MSRIGQLLNIKVKILFLLIIFYLSMPHHVCDVVDKVMTDWLLMMTASMFKTLPEAERRQEPEQS